MPTEDLFACLAGAGEQAQPTVEDLSANLPVKESHPDLGILKLARFPARLLTTSAISCRGCDVWRDRH